MPTKLPPHSRLHAATSVRESSVTGQMISEADANGGRAKTNVYLGKSIIADDEGSWGVRFKTTDPIAGSVMQSELSGEISSYGIGRSESNALGDDVPTQEPEIQEPHIYQKGGHVTNPEYGCVDPDLEMPMSCDTLAFLINTGVVSPNRIDPWGRDGVIFWQWSEEGEGRWEADFRRRGPEDYPGFAKDDQKVVEDGLADAQKLAKKKECDEALKEDGIPSLAKLLESVKVEGQDANVFDGRVSTLKYWDSTEKKQKTIAEYFREKKKSVGAAVFWNLGPKKNNVMFIGDYFFNPPDMTNVGYQRAFMIMHEAVHQFGIKTDADFGGSKKLSQKLVEKCFPVLKGRLGGVS